MNLLGGSEYKVYNLIVYCILWMLILEYVNRVIVGYGNIMFILINFEFVKWLGD